MDVDGAALKLVHTAASLVRRRYARLHGLVRDERRPEGLAALRTVGIAIVRDGRAAALKNQLANLDAAAPAASRDAPEELWGDDVVRGLRMEVQDVTGNVPGEWRSVCRRAGTYHLLADDGTVLDSFEIPDRDTSSARATSADAEASPLYVHEALVRWTGWSLVAPRPGRRIKPQVGTRPEDGRDVPTQDEVAVPPAPEVRPELHLAALFRVDGKLPRLRLGRRYRFRLAAVDLAGGDAAPSDTTPSSDAITYRRFEPLAPPALLPAAPFTAGESNERLVIRSDVSRSTDDYVADVLKPIDPDYRAASVRHVFPAKVTHEQAEQHGCLDDAIGSTAPGKVERGWNVSLRTDNALSITSLPDLDNPSASVPFGQPDAVTIAGSDETYAINRHDGPLPTPYLPDPLAAAVTLRGLPGTDRVPATAALQVEPVPGTTEHALSCRCPMRPGPRCRHSASASSSGRARSTPRPARLLRPHQRSPALGRGEPRAHGLPGEGRDRAGVVLLRARGRPAGLAGRRPVARCRGRKRPGTTDRRRLALDGVAGAHAYAVHAVPRPLAAAQLSKGDAGKTLGATCATVTARMRIDPATTGQITLMATWEDERDEERVRS